PDGANVTVNSTGLIRTTTGASVGDVQGVSVPSNNSAGTFTVTVPGFGTTAVSIPFNAAGNPTESGPTPDVQTALQAIPGLAGKVTVTTTQVTSAAAGQSGRFYLVVFDPSLGDVQQMTFAATGMAAAPTGLYLAQARTETINSLTLNAGTGESADVNLA